MPPTPPSRDFAARAIQTPEQLATLSRALSVFDFEQRLTSFGARVVPNPNAAQTFGSLWEHVQAGQNKDVDERMRQQKERDRAAAEERWRVEEKGGKLMQLEGSELSGTDVDDEEVGGKIAGGGGVAKRKNNKAKMKKRKNREKSRGASNGNGSVEGARQEREEATQSASTSVTGTQEREEVAAAEELQVEGGLLVVTALGSEGSLGEPEDGPRDQISQEVAKDGVSAESFKAEDTGVVDGSDTEQGDVTVSLAASTCVTPKEGADEHADVAGAFMSHASVEHSHDEDEEKSRNGMGQLEDVITAPSRPPLASSVDVSTPTPHLEFHVEIAEPPVASPRADRPETGRASRESFMYGRSLSQVLYGIPEVDGEQEMSPIVPLPRPRIPLGPRSLMPTPHVPRAPAPLPIPSDTHPLPLSHTWTLYFSSTSSTPPRRLPSSSPLPQLAQSAPMTPTSSAEAYSHALFPIFTSSTVEDLLGSWKALRRKIATAKGRAIEPLGAPILGGQAGLGVQGLAEDSNFHFFREGVKPMWEDPWCAKGGKIMMAGNAAHMDDLFLQLVLLLAGDVLPSLCAPFAEGRSNVIVGVCVSRRKSNTRIEVWLGGRSPLSIKWIDRVELELKRLTGEKVYPYKSFNPALAPKARQ